MTDSGECRSNLIPISNHIIAFKTSEEDVVFFDTDRGDISSRTTFKGDSFCFYKDKLLVVN